MTENKQERKTAEDFYFEIRDQEAVKLGWTDWFNVENSDLENNEKAEVHLSIMENVAKRVCVIAIDEDATYKKASLWIESLKTNGWNDEYLLKGYLQGAYEQKLVDWHISNEPILIVWKGIHQKCSGRIIKGDSGRTIYINEPYVSDPDEVKLALAEKEKEKQELKEVIHAMSEGAGYNQHRIFEQSERIKALEEVLNNLLNAMYQKEKLPSSKNNEQLGLAMTRGLPILPDFIKYHEELFKT